MSFDYVMIDALSLELNKKLQGSRVLKIFQPERDKIIFSLRTANTIEQLLISVDSANYRFQTSSLKFKNPEEAPMFCMLLRKYLTSGKLVSVRQYNSDRIIKIAFICGAELGLELKRSLIVEFFGRAKNIILLDEDDKIIDALRKTSFTENAERAILPGLIYKPPIKRKPDFFTLEKQEIISKISEIESADEDRLYNLLISSFTGISPLIARELVSRRLNGEELFSLCMNLRYKYEKKDYKACLVSLNGKPEEFSFTQIIQYGDKAENIFYPEFSEMLDDFYNEKEVNESKRALSKNILKKLKSTLKREVGKLNLRFKELEETKLMEEYRQKGELISSYIWKIKRGDEFLECENYLEAENKLVKIDLDPRKSPAENSAIYFKKYRKAKSASHHLSELIESSKNKIMYLEEQISHLECADSVEEMSYLINEYKFEEKQEQGKSKQAKKTRKKREIKSYISQDGFEILLGKSSEENERLSFKIADRNDIWLHAKDLPGSHVIIKTYDKKPSEETLELAAAIAAYYSKGREQGKVLVDYTPIRKVKRHPSGLSGLVRYEAEGTIIVSPENVKKIEALNK